MDRVKGIAGTNGDSLGGGLDTTLSRPAGRSGVESFTGQAERQQTILRSNAAQTGDTLIARIQRGTEASHSILAEKDRSVWEAAEPQLAAAEHALRERTAPGKTGASPSAIKAAAAPDVGGTMAGTSDVTPFSALSGNTGRLVSTTASGMAPVPQDILDSEV